MRPTAYASTLVLLALAFSGCVVIDDKATESDATSSTGDSTTDDTTSTSTSTGSTSVDVTTAAPTSTGSTTAETTTDGATDGTTTAADGPGFDPEDAGVQACAPVIAADPYELQGVDIKGDSIFFAVAYAGGCQPHDFGLCWDGAFAESQPVQVDLELGHDANDDACDAYPMEEIVRDLTPLKQAWIDAYQQQSGAITIHVGDFTVLYQF